MPVLFIQIKKHNKTDEIFTTWYEAQNLCNTNYFRVEILPRINVFTIAGIFYKVLN